MAIYPVSVSDRVEPFEYDINEGSLCDDCGFALDVVVEGVLHQVCAAEYVLNGCMTGIDVSGDLVTSCEYKDQCRKVVR